MSLVIPNGFAAVALELKNEFDPDPWFVTYGIDITSTTGTPAGWADTIATAYSEGLNGLMSNQVTLRQINFTVGQPDPPYIPFEVPVGLVGTSTSEMLPQNCALLVKKATSRAGRPGRGRFFWPGMLREAQVSQTGEIPTGERTTLQTAFNTFFDIHENGSVDPTVEAAPMVLLHNSGVPGGVTPTPITSLVVDATISTQRRRLR